MLLVQYIEIIARKEGGAWERGYSISISSFSVAIEHCRHTAASLVKLVYKLYLDLVSVCTCS